jgi:hypothetical protein
VDAGICETCCVSAREITIDCPYDCSFLREARKHESLVKLTPDQVPNQDVRVTEDFVRKQENFVLWIGHTLTRAMEKERAVDADAREALDAIIQTYRTRESGLIYETRSPNPYAAAMQESIKSAIDAWRKNMAEVQGMDTVRDSDALGVLVFLQRLGLQHDNGRRRGRVFYDFLIENFPAASPEGAAPAPSLAL